MPKRKWAKYVEGLPKETDLDGERSKLIEGTIALLLQGRDESPNAVAELYVRERTERDRIKDLLSAQQLRLDAAEALVAKRFNETNTLSISIEGVGSVSHSQEPVANVVDRVAFLKWVRENGHESELNLAWQTTNSITKELLEAGEPIPDGLALSSRDKISLRRS